MASTHMKTDPKILLSRCRGKERHSLDSSSTPASIGFTFLKEVVWMPREEDVCQKTSHNCPSLICIHESLNLNIRVGMAELLRHDTIAMTMMTHRSGNQSSKLKIMVSVTLAMMLSSSSSSFTSLTNAYALSSVTMPSSRVSRNGNLSRSSTAMMALSLTSKVGNYSNKGSHMLGVRGGGGTISTTTTSIQSSSSSTAGDGSDGVSSSSSIQQSVSKLRQFGSKNFFLLGMFLVVGCAKLFPMLGKDGGILRSELFVGKFGVSLIFLLSGLSLEVSELTQAVTNFKLNATIQLSTFLLWPFLIGVPMKNLLLNVFPQLFPKPLVDGLLILSCLPTTINMCIMLTSASGGNVATSICNAVISNLLGIFATPALLFYFFGTQISLPFIDMLLKLCNKVLLPVGKCLLCKMVGLRRRLLTRLFYKSLSSPPFLSLCKLQQYQ